MSSTLENATNMLIRCSCLELANLFTMSMNNPVRSKWFMKILYNEALAASLPVQQTCLTFTEYSKNTLKGTQL